MANQVLNTRIVMKHDTCLNWDLAIGFVPLNGEIIIYDDYQTFIDKTTGNKTHKPGIKIGNGVDTVSSLSFIDADLRDELLAHINDDMRHVSDDDRLFWNNKVSAYVSNDTLSLTTGKLPE